MLLLGLYLSAYQSVIDKLNSSLGIGAAWMSLFVSLYFLGAISAPAPAGELSDRIGKKRVLLFACAIVIIGIFLTILTNNLIITGMGIFMTGAGAATLEGLLSAKITDLCPENSERLMNYSQLFFCVGAVLGPMLTLMVNIIGGSWQAGLFVIAFLFTLASLTLFLLPNDKNDSFRNANNNDKPAAYSISLIKDVRMILLFLAMLIYVGAEEGAAFFAGSYFSGKSAGNWGEISLSLFWAGMILGRFAAGKLHRHINAVILTSLIISAISSVILQFEMPPALCSVFFLLTGLGMAAVWPIIMSVCTRLFKHCSGTAGGFMMTGGALGGILLPALMGFVSGNLGVRLAFIIIPLAMTAVLVLWLKARSYTIR